jgi:hypothetical protein
VGAPTAQVGTLPALTGTVAAGVAAGVRWLLRVSPAVPGPLAAALAVVREAVAAELAAEAARAGHNGRRTGPPALASYGGLAGLLQLCEQALRYPHDAPGAPVAAAALAVTVRREREREGEREREQLCEQALRYPHDAPGAPVAAAALAVTVRKNCFGHTAVGNWANRDGRDFGWGVAPRGRFATPADFPLHDGTPHRGLRVRRWVLGFVHRSRPILNRAVPNLS